MRKQFNYFSVAKSVKKTKAFARVLLRRGVRIFALVGELGSGKTTFAQGLARALGIRRRITSPTFIIMNHRKIPINQLTNTPINHYTDFYHIDAYRLYGARDFRTLNLKTIMAKRTNVVVIEWAEKVRRSIPKNAVWVSFKHHKDPKRRVITVIE